jgi:hypothetical protein
MVLAVSQAKQTVAPNQQLAPCQRLLRADVTTARLRWLDAACLPHVLVSAPHTLAPCTTMPLQRRTQGPCNPRPTVHLTMPLLLLLLPPAGVSAAAAAATPTPGKVSLAWLCMVAAITLANVAGAAPAAVPPAASAAPAAGGLSPD